MSAKHTTSEHHNRTLHWVNVLLVQDRITGEGMDNSTPQMSVFNLYNADFIPSRVHHEQLLDSLFLLFTRVVTDRIPAFASFQKAVTRHIPHNYSKETEEASVQVITYHASVAKPQIDIICNFDFDTVSSSTCYACLSRKSPFRCP